MKSISLVTSKIRNISVEKDANDVVIITVVGSGVDGSDGSHTVANLVMNWDDLPVQVQNTGSTFLKHLSREFNNLVAAEDVETW